MLAPSLQAQYIRTEGKEIQDMFSHQTVAVTVFPLPSEWLFSKD